MSAVSPLVNDLNDPFWRAAAEGRLVLPHCVATGRAFWPPGSLSPFVTSGAVDWRVCSATGILVSCVVYRRGFHPAFQPLMPYAVGLVELDAGPRLQAHIATPDAATAPHAGDRVEIRFQRLLDGEPAVPVAERLG